VNPDPERPAVPGLGPADGQPLDMSQDPDRFRPEEHPRFVEPVPPSPLRGLDMSQDPDRYDPTREEPAPPELPRGLDMSQDPDRYLPPGQGQTLTDLLGKAGAQEDDRDGYQWVAGLLGVFAFLALVAFLFNSVLTP
jgi:hypothetical protein